MPTKDEILQKCTAKKYDVSPNSSNSFTDDLFAAMDEYAKQECMYFMKWCYQNGYEFSGYDHITNEPLFHSANLHNESAETVYELYKHDQSLQR